MAADVLKLKHCFQKRRKKNHSFIKKKKTILISLSLSLVHITLKLSNKIIHKVDDAV